MRYQEYDDNDGQLDSDDLAEGVEPWDEDDEAKIDVCPHCGQEIYEDAERCPHCETYLSAADSLTKPKPWWIVLGVFVVLAMIYWWTIGIH